jgi:hypothetical protein
MEIPDDDIKFHNENLHKVKYDSKFMIINAGTMYVLFVIFIFEGILLFFTKPFFRLTKKGKLWYASLAR